MTAMIPVDAIDPEAGYREWVRQYLWHIDQIPPLLDTVTVVAHTTIRASQTDKVVVSGGGYVDNVPIQDGGAPVDAEELWDLARRYVLAVAMHIGYCPAPGVHGGIWSGRTRITDVAPATVRTVAYGVTAWLAELVEHIIDWPDLAPLEDELFALVRRMRGQYGAATARRARPRLCTICGERAVVVDWVDGVGGSPKPVQVGKCKVCGQPYTARDS